MFFPRLYQESSVDYPDMVGVAKLAARSARHPTAGARPDSCSVGTVRWDQHQRLSNNYDSSTTFRTLRGIHFFIAS